MERKAEIQMSEGSATGFFYPGASDKGRGVLFLTDAGGIRRAVRDAAARLASHGYAVLLPNIFHRCGDPPFFTPPLDFANPEVRATFGRLVASLPPSAMEQDCARYLDFIAAQPETSDAPLAVVGYCMTGAMSLRAAAACPDRVGVAASFHGGRLCTDAPDSPHLLLPRIKARLYFGHAVQDRSMPQEAIDTLDGALSAWGGRYESELYEGARHGWTSADSPVYDREQSERAFEKLLALLGG